MRALHALFENGQIRFPFDYPEYAGPVSVLIIFPDDPFDDLEDENSWQEDELEIPF